MSREKQPRGRADAAVAATGCPITQHSATNLVKAARVHGGYGGGSASGGYGGGSTNGGDSGCNR